MEEQPWSPPALKDASLIFGTSDKSTEQAGPESSLYYLPPGVAFLLSHLC